MAESVDFSKKKILLQPVYHTMGKSISDLVSALYTHASPPFGGYK